MTKIARTAKRTRKIIRNYLRLATLVNAPETPAEERARLAAKLERADARLATLPKYGRAA